MDGGPGSCQCGDGRECDCGRRTAPLPPAYITGIAEAVNRAVGQAQTQTSQGSPYQGGPGWQSAWCPPSNQPQLFNNFIVGPTPAQTFAPLPAPSNQPQVFHNFIPAASAPTPLPDWTAQPPGQWVSNASASPWPTAPSQPYQTRLPNVMSSSPWDTLAPQPLPDFGVLPPAWQTPPTQAGPAPPSQAGPAPFPSPQYEEESKTVRPAPRSLPAAEEESKTVSKPAPSASGAPARRKPGKCSHCQQLGHNKKNKLCPLFGKEAAAVPKNPKRTRPPPQKKGV
jgi:hypothetical protein